MTHCETEPSDRAKEHAALLKAAMDRPGVYEVIRAWPINRWQKSA